MNNNMNNIFLHELAAVDETVVNGWRSTTS